MKRAEVFGEWRDLGPQCLVYFGKRLTRTCVLIKIMDCGDLRSAECVQ